MKLGFKEDFIKIYQTERGILILMILNLLLSIGLLIFSLINLNPNSAVVKIGYGDIGGYRDGSWADMLAFPLLAIIFGVFHNYLSQTRWRYDQVFPDHYYGSNCWHRTRINPFARGRLNA